MIEYDEGPLGGIQFYWDEIGHVELKNDVYIREQILALMMGWA